MKADIIIPVYKPDETFCLLLQKLREQTFVVHRVIIFNTEEKYWKIATEKYPIQKALEALNCDYSLTHISQMEFDHGGTRLAAAKTSDADVLIFMTQDAIPANDMLVKNLVQVFSEDAKVAVAYARQLPKEDCHIVERYTRQFNYPENSRKKGKQDIKELGIKTFFCSDVCAAYRRDLFEQLGGFEHPVIFNEDMFFAANAIMQDYFVAYCAEAEVYHSHNYSMKQQFQRNFDLAVSQKQHPEIFEQISSEAEGMKLVKSTIVYLCKIKKPWLVVHLGFQCIGKYAGYLMGKRYEKLSKKQILKYSMNPGYWKKIWAVKDRTL